VQIKSTASLSEGRYQVKTSRNAYNGAVPYQPSEVDFLVAYVIPDDSYFIFPIRETPRVLKLRPKGSRRRGIREPYREAWHLLRPPK
jgi:hypothetical protein